MNASCVYAVLGLKTEALDLLRRAVQNGYWHADIIERDPDFISIRDEPEFQRLVAELRTSGSGSAHPHAGRDIARPSPPTTRV